MNAKTHRCPACGEAISFIREIVDVNATVFCDDDGNIEYSGENDVLWDSQRAFQASRTVACMQDHEWETEVSQ